MGKATDIGSLVASLGLDDVRFHQDLEKAARGVGSFSAKSNRHLAKAEAGWKNMTGSLTKYVSQMNPLAATVGLIGGPAGFGLLVNQSMKATAEIQRNAKMAGLGVEAYQELAYAGSKYGVVVDGMTDGMKELALRGDEFVKTGAGPGAEAFERLGYAAEDVNARLADTPEFLSDIISRMEGLETAAQIRIADELFGGTGGEQFVAMIQAGAKSFDDMRKEAHKLGLVMDKNLVESSVKARKTAEALTKVLGANFNTVVATLAPNIEDVAGNMSNWVKDNKTFLTQDIPGHIKSFAGEVKGFVDSDAFERMSSFFKLMTKGGLFSTGKMGLPGLISEFTKGVSDKKLAQLKQELEQARLLSEHPDLYGVTQGDVKIAERRLHDYQMQLMNTVNSVGFLPDHKAGTEKSQPAPVSYVSKRPDFVNYDALNLTDKERRMTVDPDQAAWVSDWVEKRKAGHEAVADDWKEKHMSMYADTQRMSDLSALTVYEYGEKAVKVADDTGSAFQDAFSGWANSYSSTLNDMLWESEFSFGKIAESFGKMVTQMMIQQKLVQPFTNWASGGIDSIGSWIGSFFHEGGIVGSGEGRQGAVSPLVFAGASKFHNGLMPDEFPAILQKGEGVFTPEQMRALGSGSNRPLDIQVVVKNELGVQARTREETPKFDGKRWVKTIVLEAVNGGDRQFKNNMKAALQG